MTSSVDFTRRGFGAVALAATALAARADEKPAPAFPVADIGGGIRLRYLDVGLGESVVFVHGSLSDLSYWNDQLAPFGRICRPIAYSRRYNWPNDNPAQPMYSAIVDAADLARLIETLNLAPAHVVGHSYGALAGLFLAAQRPELVRTLTLAEPPAVSLLAHIQGERAAEGAKMYDDIRRRMVAPMRAAFAKGRTEAGVAVFIDYVFDDPQAWDRLSVEARAQTLRDAHEWEVMLPAGVLFPPIAPEAVRAIATPVLMLSGAKSYPFLGLVDEELMRLLPHARRIVFPDAGHQMWLQEPQKCREAVLAFQARRG